MKKLNSYLLLFLISFFVSENIYNQVASKTIHVDSLTKEEFLDMDEQKLSITRDGNSTELLLKVYSEGRFVTGLAGKTAGYEIFLKSSSDVTPYCKDVKLEEVSEKDAKDDLFISVVLDYSGSMYKDYPEMQVAAKRFIDYLNGANFTRFNFHTVVDKEINPLSTKKPRSPLKDNFQNYGGATALYDGILEGVYSFPEEAKNKFVVVFTDGIENASGKNADTVIKIARDKNVKVIGVFFGFNSTSQKLDEICTQTNFAYPDYDYFVSVKNMDAVEKSFDQIAEELFGQYYKIISTCKDEVEFNQLFIKKIASNDSILLNIDRPMAKINKVGDPIYFGAFQFDLSKTSLLNRGTNDNFSDLADDIIQHLMAHPNDEIVIEGHASPDGEDDTNWQLSRDRAKFVYTKVEGYLERKYKNDISALKAMRRIKINYHGHDKPIFPVESRFNYENRRVNILLNKN